MSEQEDREFDKTISFLEFPESEYLDRASKRFRRSRFELCGEALIALQEGPLTTTDLFVNKIHTNLTQFKPILHILLTKGFVEEYKMRRSTKHFFEITEAGDQAAELYKRAKALFKQR